MLWYINYTCLCFIIPKTLFIVNRVFQKRKNPEYPKKGCLSRAFSLKELRGGKIYKSIGLIFKNLTKI
ncbi:hypothetical protein HX99_04560 [Peptococcaceae bacterium SCADC1_2_3]|nr:hypothetical protein DK28_0205730 [Peptococcaceae bacterium SCADC1_2_3]HBQ28569.1 hypothetical protein [Desulfotomaculum sp.]KFI35703.1 hypothetical protein HY00_02440 [Peptococcaceae bacterium SCADC1_2_3]KFI36981.1 hypothetical protein HX99_04560 [Peptococcaceae bacterium SCADC1_2_3]KFI37537.1 hypothetical protein HY02_05860 [Peptococcaceae bacterium SCADC1_2_3]